MIEPLGVVVECAERTPFRARVSARDRVASISSDAENTIPLRGDDDSACCIADAAESHVLMFVRGYFRHDDLSAIESLRLPTQPISSVAAFIPSQSCSSVTPFRRVVRRVPHRRCISAILHGQRNILRQLGAEATTRKSRGRFMRATRPGAIPMSSLARSDTRFPESSRNHRGQGRPCVHPGTDRKADAYRPSRHSLDSRCSRTPRTECQTLQRPRLWKTQGVR